MVDIKVLQETAKKFHVEITDDEISELVKAADYDNDNKVGKEDFRKMLKKTHFI